jgi:hypothetical protein
MAGLVAQQHPVDQQLLGLDQRFVQLQPHGHRQAFPGLFVGPGEAVRPRMRTTHRHPPRSATRNPPELAEHEITQRLRAGAGPGTSVPAG